MLRITVHEEPELLTFQLEGKLAGPWVRELEECRERTRACRRHAVRFDLAGVTYIDAAGKAFLASMHHQGAELNAVDCLTRAVVSEIVNTPLRNWGGSKHEGQSPVPMHQGRGR